MNKIYKLIIITNNAKLSKGNNNLNGEGKKCKLSRVHISGVEASSCFTIPTNFAAQTAIIEK